MTKDNRPSFREGVTKFCEFLTKEDWPTELIWINSGRLRSHNRDIWIYRPEDLADQSIGEAYYTGILEGDSSIKLLGLGHLDGKSIACIDKYAGEPGHFYMSLLNGRMILHSVRSPVAWAWIRFLSLFRKPAWLLTDLHLPA